MIDYCIIKSKDNDTSGDIHKKVVLLAMDIFNKRFVDSNEYTYIYDEDKMICMKINKEDFFNSEKEDFYYLNNLLFHRGIDNLDIYEWNTDVLLMIKIIIDML